MSTSRTGAKGGGIRKQYISTPVGSMKATKRRIKQNPHSRVRMQFYSRAEARKFAEKHFRMRTRASHFIGAFIWRMTRAIKGAIGAPIVADNRRLGNAIGVKALQYGERGQSGVSVQAMYGYKHATTAAKKVTTEQSANQLEHYN
jgi:hypothetical protein